MTPTTLAIKQNYEYLFSHMPLQVNLQASENIQQCNPTTRFIPYSLPIVCTRTQMFLCSGYGLLYYRDGELIIGSRSEKSRGKLGESERPARDGGRLPDRCPYFHVSLRPYLSHCVSLPWVAGLFCVSAVCISVAGSHVAVK